VSDVCEKLEAFGRSDEFGGAAALVVDLERVVADTIPALRQAAAD
jgi:hypothetical protein